MLLFVATLVAAARAIAAPAEGQGSALPSYVRLITAEPDSGYIPLPDSVFNEIAARTIFKVNKTRLNLNDPLLHELADSVLPYAKVHGWVLTGMDLRGAASPEGPYDNNVRLSRGRAAALLAFLRDYIEVDSINLETTTTAEDYGYLLWEMQRAGDPACEVLEQIIARHGLDNPRAIKSDLRAVDGQALWYRLLYQYYPSVRSARVVFYFRQKEDRELVVAVLPEPEVKVKEIEERPVIEPVPYAVAERPHLLSLSSNLLYDAFYMPDFGWAPTVNIAAEYFPRHGNFTYRAAFIFPYYHKWSKHKFYQIRDYHLEVRRYFDPGFLHTGAYLAAYANVTKYGIGLSATRGWEGEGWGGALKIGYVMPLGSGRWRLDFHAALGAWSTRYDPYVFGNPITGDTSGNDYYYDYTGDPRKFRRRNHRLTWVGPAEVGITLSFDLLYYRLRHSGASTHRKEVITW